MIIFSEYTAPFWGCTGSGIWAYNVDTGLWRQISTGVNMNITALDENANIIICDEITKKIYCSNIKEPVNVNIKTKTFKISDERDEVIRDIAITYKSDSPLSLNLYTEGEESVENICYGGMAIALKEYSTFPVSNVFDGDLNTHYRMIWGNPLWIKYDLGYGKDKISQRFRIKQWKTYDTAWIKDFKLEGSKNDMDWTELYSGQCSQDDNWNDFKFNNNMTYRYYRFTQNNVWNPVETYISITEMELLGMTKYVIVLPANAYVSTYRFAARFRAKKIKLEIKEAIKSTSNIEIDRIEMSYD